MIRKKNKRPSLSPDKGAAKQESQKGEASETEISKTEIEALEAMKKSSRNKSV